MLFLLLLHFLQALNQSHYRQCKDSPFCARNRFIDSRIWTAQANEATITDSQYILPIKDETYHNQLNFFLSFHADKIIHFKFAPVKESFSRYDCSSEPTVINKTTLGEPLQITENKNDTHIELTVGSSRVIIQIDPFQFTIYDQDEPIITGNSDFKAVFESNIDQEEFPNLYKLCTFDNYNDTLKNGPSSVAMTFKYHSNNVEGIKFIGLPLHSLESNIPSTVIKGEATTDPIRLFNTDTNEYLSDSVVSLYGAIPYLIGHSGNHSTGLFWCNPSETWVDIENAISSSRFISETGFIDCYVFSGTHKEVIKSYSKINGRAPLPQLFALGYHQSRWTYKNTKEIESISAKMDKDLIPHDSIWLDLDHTDNKKYFTFDPTHFNNIKKVLKQFQKENRYLVSLVDPHLKVERDYQIYYEAKESGYFIKAKNRRDYFADCWPGRSGFIDFFNPSAREWWADQFMYKNYRKSHINLFIWNDMNEPSVMRVPDSTVPRDCIHYGKVEDRDLHNLNGHMMIQATYEGLLKRNTEQHERPFILTRSFFAGSQKYAFTWTGDNLADWDHLRNSISMTLTLGVCGFPFSGSDVGGFFKSPDQELLLRWYQLGAFCYPFFRCHCHHLSERREPYMLKGDYHTGTVNAIQERYRLLPLWYTLSYQTTLDGQPIVRPLWWEFDDPEVQEIETQVMIGDSLMVVPSLSKEENTIHAYIPRTRWFEFRSLKELKKGGEVVNIPYDKEFVPLFVKGGKVVFTKQQIRKASIPMIPDPFTLIIAVDDHNCASGEIYIDDGHTYNYSVNNAKIYRRVSFDGQILTSTEIEQSNRDSDFFNEYSATIELIKIGGLEKMPTAIKTQDGLELDILTEDGVLQITTSLDMKYDFTLTFEYE